MHTASQDPYFEKILRDAIVRNWIGPPPSKLALQHLRRLWIASAETKVVGPEREFWVLAPAYMEKERPFFLLPKLEEFEIVDAQFGRVTCPLFPEESSALTHLSMAFHAPVVRDL
jgi:hypothetical protein